MKILVDGVKVVCLDNVKFILSDVIEDGDLHVTVNTNGVIYDVVKNDEITDSSWYNHEDLLPASYEEGCDD